MRVASFVIGLLAGLAGLVASFTTLGVGGFAAAFEADGAGTVMGLSGAAILMSILLIIGSAFVMSKRERQGRWLLLIGTVGGFFSLSIFWFFAGILGLVATILGFMVKAEGHPVSR